MLLLLLLCRSSGHGWGQLYLYLHQAATTFRLPVKCLYGWHADVTNRVYKIRRCNSLRWHDIYTEFTVNLSFKIWLGNSHSHDTVVTLFYVAQWITEVHFLHSYAADFVSVFYFYSIYIADIMLKPVVDTQWRLWELFCTSMTTIHFKMRQGMCQLLGARIV